MSNPKNYTISNAWICQVEENSIKPIFGDLKITNGFIEGISKRNFEEFIRGKLVVKGEFDAKGRAVTIPHINFHDHIYSRLAKGLAISGPMNNFQNILENLWWKLDILLDHEMIKASAQMAAIESIRNGVTYIFDHHASPANTNESLKEIKDVLTNFGIRGVLCFETSDRNGNSKRQEAIVENINFHKNFTDENFKSMFGLHASFTLQNDTLQSVSENLMNNELGIHIHICEDESDREISHRLYGNFPVQRLEKFNLLNGKSILAHCIHLTDEDYKIIADSGSAIVYNLDSNLNNAVGLSLFSQRPDEIPALIGTDGMHADIPKSIKQYFLINRFQKNSFEKAFGDVMKMYFDQHKFAKKYFNDLADLQVGSRADLVIWDYVPPTPITTDNFWGHYIYGILERQAASVIQDGNVLMNEFELEVSIVEKINNNIYQQGVRLFNNFNN